MSRGRGAILLVLALLAFVCVPLVEAGWGCADGVSDSDCKSACCRTAGTPLLAGARAGAATTSASGPRVFETAGAPISTDPRDILHVPKPALV
jgi:hypothetical protein